MSIALITGPANAGKAHVVMQALRAHIGHGREPLLVVPTEADQARYRRELAEGGLALGVRVERFEGLLARVLGCASPGEPALGALARERLVAWIASRAGMDVSPGLARALTGLIGELEAQRVTPGRLRQAIAAWGQAEGRHGGVTLAERLCSVLESYQSTLAAIGRADRELRVTRALDDLRRAPSLWGVAPVLLYGFDDLTELQLDTIETLGAVVDAPVTVSLAYEPGRAVFAGRAEAFHRLRPLAATHTELPPRAEHYAPRARAALHHLERSMFECEPPRLEPGGAVRLLEGAGPRAELQLVAEEVRSLLDGGMAAEQIAIVHRAPEMVMGQLGEALDDLEIPHSLGASARFADSAIGRALLGLLRCAQGEGRLHDLLGWLRAPGVLDHPEFADHLEASALRKGIEGAEPARELWEAEHWPLTRIERLRVAGERGARELIDASIAELHTLFCAPRRRAAAVLAGPQLSEAYALSAARAALDELRELICAVPDMGADPRVVVDVLEGVVFQGGEPAAAGRVAVAAPLSLRARRVRALFLCGMQEGVFPAPARPQPLLGQDERRQIALASGLMLPREVDALAAERYLLYALCSRPEERLTLSWHTTDDEGTPVAPSLFIDDVCDLFSEPLREQARRRGAVSPAPGVRPVVEVMSPAGGARPPAAAMRPSLARERPIEPLRDERLLAQLSERTLWSASSLERWAACPVRWFVERLLHADQLDADPEPLARGALAHIALRDTLERLRKRTGSARLTSENVGLAKRLLGESLQEHDESYPLSIAPERVPGAARRLRADLERYLEWAAEGERMLEPTHMELEFGFARKSAGGEVDDGGAGGMAGGYGSDAGGEVGDGGAGGKAGGDGSGEGLRGLPALELGEGVSIRGRIDRVDIGPGGEAVVYDYKGRHAPPGAKWASEGALQVALYMQAVQSLLGATPAGGFYQPLAGRDIRARGLLDRDSALGLDCVRTDVHERDSFQEVLERCREAALAAAAQARAGALEPRPATCSYGGGCMYPTICRCER